MLSVEVAMVLPPRIAIHYHSLIPKLLGTPQSSSPPSQVAVSGATDTPLRSLREVHRYSEGQVESR